jgi:hypothetical protein
MQPAVSVLLSCAFTLKLCLVRAMKPRIERERKQRGVGIRFEFPFILVLDKQGEENMESKSVSLGWKEK